MFKRSSLVAFLAVIVLVVAACGGDDDSAEATEPTTPAEPTPSEEPSTGDELAVELAEENGSGQSGTATLTPTADGQLLVRVELSNPPENPQPIHIHMGTCESVGEVAYPLTNVEGGNSETTIDASASELQGGEFVINAHESEENIENYVACGPIQ